MKGSVVVNTLSKITGLFSKPPYKLGAALSGGGVRGFAHIGVLQALDEAGLQPDIVAGVSAGAVAAAFYGARIPFDRMLKAFAGMKFNDLADLQVPKDGFFKLDKFCAFMRRNIPYERLEELPIKTVICATDIDTGQAVVFEEGPIADLVIASCSIPVVFRPKVIGGVRYVDGGVLHNLPAWAIRERCKTLYGVNVSPMPPKRKPAAGIIDLATTSFRLMAKCTAEPDMKLCDEVIRIDGIAHYSVFNLKAIQQIYKAGYRTAAAYLAEKS